MRRYDVDYEEPKVLQSWDAIVGRYKRHWNVFALDLKNENHGPCSWGTGDSFTCWKAAAERIMKHIAQAHPDFKGLFFVGGIWGSGGHWCVAYLSTCCRINPRTETHTTIRHLHIHAGGAATSGACASTPRSWARRSSTSASSTRRTSTDPVG